MKFNMRKIFDVMGNLFHLFFLLGLGVMVFHAIIPIEMNSDVNIEVICSSIGINEIFTFIGAVAFILFGIVGIYDFAYLNGLGFLVPPTFVKFKEMNYMKQAEKMMELYYKRDIEFIQEYEKERTDFMLQAMGIQEKQFKYINYEIVKARVMPDRCIFDLKRKAVKTLFHKEFIIDQSTLMSSKRVYDKVDYFMNLYTALYDVELCKTVAGIMSRFIVLSLREKLQEVDCIVIPRGSNFLLGLEVGKILHKAVISMLEEERIYKGVFWDGIYDKSKHHKIIVIHDVLVTGKRIYESIEMLPENTYTLEGIYSLFKYNHKDFSSIADLKKHGIEERKINCLLDIDESKLKKIYEGTYEADTC